MFDVVSRFPGEFGNIINGLTVADQGVNFNGHQQAKGTANSFSEVEA